MPAWKKSIKRRPLSTSKYYFFDVGVVRSVQGRAVSPGTPEFGEAFETFIMQEMVCYRDYVSNDPLYFWWSSSGFEVDFIVGDHTAIAVKAKENVSPVDLRSLRALSEKAKLKQYLCVSLERRTRRIGQIMVLPYQEFLKRLWGGGL